MIFKESTCHAAGRALSLRAPSLIPAAPHMASLCFAASTASPEWLSPEGLLLASPLPPGLAPSPWGSQRLQVLPLPITEHVLKCEQGPSCLLSPPDSSPTPGAPLHPPHPGAAPAGLMVVYHRSQQPARFSESHLGGIFIKPSAQLAPYITQPLMVAWPLMDTRQLNSWQKWHLDSTPPKPLGGGGPHRGARDSQESPLLGVLDNKPS